MPSLCYLLKTANSQPGIKGKLKSLLGQSINFPLFSKPGSRKPLTSTWLPSSSFRSFHCEISKFSSRTWEGDDLEKPFFVSEAVSRIFATPSIHGPMWQALSYHTHQVFNENSVQNAPGSVHVAAAALRCTILREMHSNIEVKFMCALQSQSETCVFGDSVWPKLWDSKSPMLDDFTKLAACKGVDFDNLSQIDWKGEFDEVRERKDIEESETHTFNFQSTFKKFFSICGELCDSASNTLLGSLICDFRELIPSSFLLDTRPEFPVIDDTRVASKGLWLLSAAYYFPHPEKELTGGEDAYFICPEKQVFGVADGVGGWAELGVDSGEYARQLMSESLKAAQEEPTGSVDAARVLKKAYSKTTCRGSSTACILALSDYGLQAVNLGDSGFIVVRNGRMIFKSPVQQHNFNFPFQLESCGAGDPVSAAELFVVEVAADDVIVAGTDGLFDNLFATEIETIVLQAKWSGMSPDVTAQKIAYLARERANDCNRQTPFSAAAQSAGYSFYGGKMDDITVIVSYVTDYYVG